MVPCWQLLCFAFQFQADSSSTLPYPLKAPLAPELESDGSDGVDSAGIFVHESTQVHYYGFDIRDFATCFCNSLCA